MLGKLIEVTWRVGLPVTLLGHLALRLCAGWEEPTFESQTWVPVLSVATYEL